MHPVLFEVAGLTVHAYAVASVLGYVVGVALGVWLGLKDGRPLRDLVDLALVVVLSALLGSKLFHVLFEAAGHKLSDGSVARGVVDLWRDDPWHWARLFEAGYVFYGGVVGAVVMGVLFCRRRGIPDLGSLGDAAVPGILFGTFVGRIGCFLAGCCYGAPTDVAWSVVFPAGHPSGGAHVHPVQLYDAAFGLVGFVAFWLLFPRRRFGGEALCAYLVVYAIFRFCTELFRADADRGVWLGGHVSTSQLVALVTLPPALVVWRRSLALVRAGKMRKPADPLPALVPEVTS
jgi:phosphatidylglycerol:prolipoprotein diacylglycerol transferase